jgi:hypothetical protein
MARIRLADRHLDGGLPHRLCAVRLALDEMALPDCRFVVGSFSVWAYDFAIPTSRELPLPTCAKSFIADFDYWAARGKVYGRPSLVAFGLDVDAFVRPCFRDPILTTAPRPEPLVQLAGKESGCVENLEHAKA